MIGLDTSFLLAAEGRHDAARWRRATAILGQLASDDLILPAQALAEMLHILIHGMGESEEAAGLIAARWLAALPGADISQRVITKAERLAKDGTLPLDDALVIAATGAAGGRYLLSDDIADGLTACGVTVINPFTAEGAARLDRLIDIAA